MSSLLAFSIIFIVGYYVLLDEDPYSWWVTKLQDWVNWIGGHISFSALPAWCIAVGFPAVIALMLDILLHNLYLDFFLNLTVLFLCTGMTSFMRYHHQIINAVYANDSTQAAKIANQWNLRRQQVEDSPDHFVPRLLGLCALRLHEDVLAVLVWYALLGPAGAVLATANYVYAHSEPAEPLEFNLVDMVAAAVSIIVVSISGNMGPALGQLSGLRPDKAALAAGDIDPQRISLEDVPKFGKLLMRAFVIGSIGTAVLLLLFI